jgi:PAS domain S-box-containing protein
MSPDKQPQSEHDRSPRDSAPGFLAGGGEMGERMRAMDWAQTALGDLRHWPQSLRSAVSILLPSRAQIVLFWGPELVTLYNDAYRPVFGVKHPRVLGLPARQAWSEIWDTGLRGLFEGVLRTGEAFWGKDLPFVLERHGFPEETFFDVSYDPVRDESGGVGGVFCIVSETTGRVVGERRLDMLRDLATRNANARTTGEACAFAMESLAARPQEVPFALAYLPGEAAGQQPGTTLALQATTPGAEALARSLDGMLATEEVRVMAIDAAAIAPAGQPQPRQAALVSIPASRAGGRAGVLVAGLNPLRPFDEHYRAFLQLVAGQLATGVANAQVYEEERKRAAALAELDRAKTAFFSNVSHEFRTPLTLMLGPLEDLIARAEDGMASEDQALLALVQRNGQRLLKLVNTLLDFARIEAGRAQAIYEATDLATLTADLASNFRSACERAGLRFDVECPALAEPAYVDREMWEKIVLNLLSNAFKFTLKGGISVRLRDAGERLELSVRDTGVGIPAEALPRMFERFHRVADARGRSHEGSGIGLALVNELVKLHGGSIGVHSALGAGATFTVAIPKGSAHLPREHVRTALAADAGTAPRVGAGPYVAEALGWLRGAAPAAAEARPQGTRRVLLADDNADLREYARRLLAEHYVVEAVADGQDAIEAARARRPDMIISDVMMPRLDGFGLLRALRVDPELRAVPVILLSARAGEEARVEGLGRGADDYLVKPFSSRELLVRVGALMSSADMHRRVIDALAQFETLFNEAPLGIYVIDDDFRIAAVNPVAKPMFGDIGDLIGRDFDQVLRILWPTTYADEVVQIFRHTLDTGEPHFVPERIEERLDRGVREFYEWQVNRIPLPGKRHGVVCYFRDISKSVMAREALRQADSRKDEFLATLAHELRNPLAPLRNALDLMRPGAERGGVPVRVHDIMERQVSHLTRLVDDLLELSRITRGALELRREAVEVSAILRNAVETSEPLIQAARHRLEVSLPGEPLWLEGDPVRLAQILANLLNNAARYTPDGGSIALSAQRKGAMAIISVRDNGSGIPKEALSRIFEMFNREVRADARGQGGLGIGLTLSRRLAEMHGGTIEAHSEGEGCGSEFIVRLPLISGAPAAVPSRPQGAGTLSRMRILVVDDNQDAAETLGMLLETFGAEVRLAHDGASAVDVFAATDPAAVLLDIGLPAMDGYQVARTLRARFPARRATLVALTGWGQEEDRRRAREAGFDHHLVKPVKIEELQALLAEVARRDSQR